MRDCPLATMNPHRTIVEIGMAAIPASALSLFSIARKAGGLPPVKSLQNPGKTNAKTSQNPSKTAHRQRPSTLNFFSRLRAAGAAFNLYLSHTHTTSYPITRRFKPILGHIFVPSLPVGDVPSLAWTYGARLTGAGPRITCHNLRFGLSSGQGGGQFGKL